MKHPLKSLLFAGFLISSFSAESKTVRYSLTIENQPVNLSGNKEVDFSLTVNGGIPAPTLEFTEGDDAEITVLNKIQSGEDVSIHWHGILLPPAEDGVPFVNTPPIYKDQMRVFKFPLRQNGTYWYHSHTMLQEQKGVFGAIIIHPKKEFPKATHDVVAVLSDWSDENADQILKNLKKDGDYYQWKKGTLRSYLDAGEQGKLKSYLKNEWTRMGGMDVSDVGYDAFLINGKKESQLVRANPGETVRLRLINAGSSSYFHVSLGGLPMKVVAADGIAIEPVLTEEIFMGMAETYDVLWTVPDSKNYELRATSQDGTGFSSAYLGTSDGPKVPANSIPKPGLYESMDHSGMDHSAMHPEEISTPSAEDESEEEDEDPITSLSVEDLRALRKTGLPKSAKIHELKLILNGDMRRYVWHLNGKVMNQDRLLSVDAGEIIRITYQNDSMMHHPMHLHGHFFRVLNGNEEFSPLKHTVDVPPMSSRTIEFYTDEPGQWMLHCHNLYHMDSGMARVVKYANYTIPPDLANLEHHDHHLQDPWFHFGKLEVASNHASANLRTSQSWNELSVRVEGEKDRSDKWDSEADLFYRRWIGNWSHLIAGGTSYGDRLHGVAGFGYTLPFLIETRWILNHEGQFRLDLEREFRWSKSFVSDLDLTWRPGNQHGPHETEAEFTFMYQPTWAWSAGLMLTSEQLGAGIEWKF